MKEPQRGATQLGLTARLRRELEDGVLRPGDRLVEVALTERYGVSRPTIRTALQELARLGLVTREPGRGATVNDISHDEAVMLLQLRLQLEPMLVSRFTKTSTDQQMATFTDATAAYARAVEVEHNLPAARRALDAFYRSLLDGAGSWALESAIEVEHAMLLVYRSRSFAEPSQLDRLRHAVGAHRSILPHMQRRDAKTAQSICARHMLEDASAVLRELRDRPARD